MNKLPRLRELYIKH